MSTLHRAGYPVRASQLGGITVILVLFLLLIVGATLSVAVKLSGSGATDATAQEDSIAALLLAESGMERASKRFADGTACTSAALKEGPVAIARGSFSIISAAWVAGNTCHIRAQGKVDSTLRTIEGDATTVIYEPFPPKYSVPAVFNTAWPETVLPCCKKGSSAYDKNTSASVDASGSMIMQTTPGKKDKFEGWRQRTLPARITGAQVVTLNLAYKMDHADKPPTDQNLRVYLVDTSGNDYLVPGADFNGPTNPKNTWITSPTLSYTIPAGIVVDRIRLYFKLTNGNDQKSQTFIWADNVRLTTSAAAYPLKAWREIVK